MTTDDEPPTPEQRESRLRTLRALTQITSPDSFLAKQSGKKPSAEDPEAKYRRNWRKRAKHPPEKRTDQ